MKLFGAMLSALMATQSLGYTSDWNDEWRDMFSELDLKKMPSFGTRDSWGKSVVLVENKLFFTQGGQYGYSEEAVSNIAVWRFNENFTDIEFEFTFPAKAERFCTDGNTVVALDSYFNSTGKMDVFEFDASVMGFVHKSTFHTSLPHEQYSYNTHFERCSVQGGTIAISSSYYNQTGAVQVYKRDEVDGWFLAEVLFPDATLGMSPMFGADVKVSPDQTKIVVGVPEMKVNATTWESIGGVVVFDANSFMHMATIRGMSRYSQCGRSVLVSDEHIMVGCPEGKQYINGSEYMTGSIEVYIANGPMDHVATIHSAKSDSMYQYGFGQFISGVSLRDGIVTGSHYNGLELIKMDEMGNLHGEIIAFQGNAEHLAYNGIKLVVGDPWYYDPDHYEEQNGKVMIWPKFPWDEGHDEGPRTYSFACDCHLDQYWTLEDCTRECEQVRGRWAWTCRAQLRKIQYGSPDHQYIESQMCH